VPLGDCELWTARVAAAAATSATFRTNIALSSGVSEDPRGGILFSGFEGCRCLAEPFPDGALLRSSVRSVTGESGCSLLRKRDDILSPILLRKGSSGMLFRQFARDC
jgi:hypothetical protein